MSFIVFLHVFKASGLNGSKNKKLKFFDQKLWSSPKPTPPPFVVLPTKTTTSFDVFSEGNSPFCMKGIWRTVQSVIFYSITVYF